MLLLVGHYKGSLPCPCHAMTPCVFPQWSVYKVTSDSLEATLQEKGEWRSATTMPGALSVMMLLEVLMHELPADN